MLSARNLKILAAGIVLLVLGYVLLAQGPVDNHLSWSVAPVVLILTYCVILPLSIIVKGDKKAEVVVKKAEKQGV